MKSWEELLPVNTTCITDDEDEVLEKVKVLLEPVFGDGTCSSTIPTLLTNVEGPLRKSTISVKLLEYNASRRTVENLELKSDVQDVMKIRSFFLNKPVEGTPLICFISFLRYVHTSKNNCLISRIISGKDKEIETGTMITDNLNTENIPVLSEAAS